MPILPPHTGGGEGSPRPPLAEARGRYDPAQTEAISQDVMLGTGMAWARLFRACAGRAAKLVESLEEIDF